MEWIKKNMMLILCLVGVLWLSGCLVTECNHNAELREEVEAVNNFWEGEESQWISRDSIQAQDIVEMKQNLMSETSARIILEEEFERFKSIQSHTRAELITRIDTLLIPYEVLDTVIINNYVDVIPVDTVNKYFIQIPRKSKFEDEWMKLYTTIDTALMIDSAYFINKFDVTIGYKKPDKRFKFLRRKEPVVELTSYSPYTKVNYVNNVTVKGKPSSGGQKILIFAGGAVAGFVGGVLIK